MGAHQSWTFCRVAPPVRQGAVAGSCRLGCVRGETIQEQEPIEVKLPFARVWIRIASLGYAKKLMAVHRSSSIEGITGKRYARGKRYGLTESLALYRKYYSFSSPNAITTGSSMVLPFLPFFFFFFASVSASAALTPSLISFVDRIILIFNN